jgi:hypothetical protein
LAAVCGFTVGDLGVTSQRMPGVVSRDAVRRAAAAQDAGDVPWIE